MLEEFIIVDMLETNNAQMVLGQPFLATASRHIDVRKGRIIFEVKGCYAVFCHTKNDVVSPNSCLLDA